MRFTRLAVLATVLSASALTEAQTKKETPADILFREGRTLLQAGQVAEACARFSESQKLEPSAGTLLNLGECYERAGRLVSAYEAFHEAEPMSKARLRQDWADTAKTRSEALRAKIPLVFLDLTEQEHVIVSVDAKTYARDVVALGIMVEIGDHTAIVKSEDETWTQAFTAAAGSKTVLKPAFKHDSKPAPIVRKVETPPSSPLKTVGVVTMAVGGAAVLGGLVFGALANTKKADVEALCPSYADLDIPRCTSADATELNNSAKTLALVSSVLTFAGFGVGLGGVALFLLAPRNGQVSFAPGPGLAGLSIRVVR
jgi:hypothetical protein